MPQERIELQPVQTEDSDTEGKQYDRAGYAEIVQNASQIAAEDGADFQLYVAFPDWDTPYVMNSRSQSSASIIKIYILGAVLELSERGALDLDQKITVRRSDMVGGAGSISGHTGEPVYPVYKLLDYMITESDNTATNVLLDTIGMDTVQDFIVRHGFTDTVIRRKMMDFRALQEGRDNLTSISDVGKFFSLISEGRLVSPRADNTMIDMLL